jgi:UDP-N-acetyl-D-mannosaminuronate dehydrogenase
MLTIQSDFRDRYVCVLGLGYVGLTLAAVMADVGFKVVGVEIRDDVLAKLRSGKAHFYEPGLDDLIQRLVRKKSIKFVKHIPNGLRASVYIVTVGTPLGPNGRVRAQPYRR